MTKTTLYIVRHGQTEWNVAKRMQGHLDSPLTELGQMQARWVGEALADVELDHIFSSSSPRAVKTTEFIKGDKAVPIILSDELKEMNLGDWEGKLQPDIEMQEPERYDDFWYSPHLFRANNGESFMEVQNRVLPELRKIIQEHTGKTILIVTHTVVVKVIMTFFEGKPLSDLWSPPYIHPACLNQVEINGDISRILLHGDITHYKDQLKI